MSRLFAFAIPIASACAYVPDSFSSRQTSFPGMRTMVGCLDVAISLVGGPLQAAPVVQYSIGNRCDRPTVVDFSAIRARSASGVSFGPELRAYDPLVELRPLPMEARTVITEQIEYRHTAPSFGRALCIDVGGLNGPPGGERWLCQDGGPAMMTLPAAGGAA
jgi:hypothetical protein